VACVAQPPKDKTKPPLRVRALRLLARREHTRNELERRLAPHAEDPAEVERLLGEFARHGWFSEERAIEQVIQARRGKFGSHRIRQDLVAKGVDAERVACAMAGLKASEDEALRALWRRKFGRAPGSAAERARQIRFLQGRGFALDAILKMLKRKDNDE
jgi:regulatory protein